MSELKPCPFCGGKAQRMAWHDDNPFGKPYFIECKKCECMTTLYETLNQAKEAWNRRATDADGA